MNQVERFLKAGVRLLGEPEYSVEVFPKGSWKKEMIVMEVFDNKGNYAGQREYHSFFDARVSAGRERIWAKLEWTMGAAIGIVSFLAIYKSNLFDPSSVNGPLLLAGIGLGVLAGIMIADGKERSSVTSAIIRELSKN